MSKSRGGRRPGAGRPAYGAVPLTVGVHVKYTEAQKAALAAHVARINEQRIAEGRSKVSITAWLREVGLAAAGASELGFIRID